MNFEGYTELKDDEKPTESKLKQHRNDLIHSFIFLLFPRYFSLSGVSECFISVIASFCSIKGTGCTETNFHSLAESDVTDGSVGPVPRIDTNFEEDHRILGITIHRTDRLKQDKYITRPVVRVHVMDINTQNYVKKEDQLVPQVLVILYIFGCDVQFPGRMSSFLKMNVLKELFRGLPQNNVLDQIMTFVSETGIL